MMRADFLERVRSYRFMAMLLFTIFLTYLFISALDSFQVFGLNLGGYQSGCASSRQIDMGLSPLQNFQAFRYEGIPWTADILMGRLGLVLVGAVIALIAAACFHRFDPAKSERSLFGNLWISLKQAVLGFITTPSQTSDHPDSNPVVVTNVTTTHQAPLPAQARLGIDQPRSYWHVLTAELRLNFKGVHWVWYAGAIALSG